MWRQECRFSARRQPFRIVIAQLGAQMRVGFEHDRFASCQRLATQEILRNSPADTAPVHCHHISNRIRCPTCEREFRRPIDQPDATAAEDLARVSCAREPRMDAAESASRTPFFCSARSDFRKRVIRPSGTLAT